jgi:hypothetical protein
MFDFRKIADDSYCLYKGGVRQNELPLSRAELDQAILDLPLSGAECAVIDFFFTGRI